MTIDRISSIETIQPNKKPGGVNQSNRTMRTDSISISQEAKDRAEQLRIKDMIAALPDENPGRIEELRRKMNDPSYIDERIINATADRIIDALWG